MDVLVLTAEDVEKLLPMRDCIRVMREALGALAEGRALVPLRMVMRMPDESGFIGVMPGYLAPLDGRGGALGMKAVTVFPRNAARGIDTHQGAVLLFEADTGRLSALMDGGTITAIRTAAVSGVATDVLARRDAAELAVLGAGVQARTHLEAIAAVRNIKKARIWSRTFERARALAGEQQAKLGIPVEAVSSAETAVRGADVIATVTASAEPVLQRSWVKDGAHINAVGSSVPNTRELDTETIVSSRLFVDRRESALKEAGDLLIPMREGALTAEHIVAELGEVITGKNAGRRSPGELTVFKSLGIAVEDVAAAAFVVEQARASRTGQTVRM